MPVYGHPSLLRLAGLPQSLPFMVPGSAHRKHRRRRQQMVLSRVRHHRESEIDIPIASTSSFVHLSRHRHLQLFTFPPQEPRPPHGPFHNLYQTLTRTLPTEYQLPPEIRTFFKDGM